MPDSRASTALRQLSGLDRELEPPGWRWSVVTVHPRPYLPALGRPHPVSAHVLRHTAITAVGRLAGYPVAQAFAGHAPPSVTGHYLHATLTEIATAVATLTGGPHPIGRTPYSRDQPSRDGERASARLTSSDFEAIDRTVRPEQVVR